MRRNAGSFVRSKLISSSLLAIGGVGMAMGMSIGLLFYVVFPPWPDSYWGVVAYAGTAGVLLSAIWLMERPGFRWNLENLRKGAKAEARVGQLVEYALTAEHCAVAHAVTAIAAVGDIDHLVATPAAVWVIETKYKRVPKNSFPEVLRRIAANMAAVRQWLPAGTPVRGCLVLAYESDIKRRPYFHDKEQIPVYTQDSLGTLMREIREEARGRQSLDEHVAKDIWKLGRVADGVIDPSHNPRLSAAAAARPFCVRGHDAGDWPYSLFPRGRALLPAGLHSTRSRPPPTLNTLHLTQT